MRLEADVAVVGSGFGGSLMALALRKRGRSVVLLERGRHPRFVIGESSTPLANLLLEDLADRCDLPRLRPLTKWGPWQRAYPDVGCGKKRGFSFVGSTIVYAHMQAVGMVNDHVVACHRYAACTKDGAAKAPRRGTR